MNKQGADWGGWQNDQRRELEGARRELQLGARAAMGDWVKDLRSWDAFVTLTFDPWSLEGSAVGSIGRVDPKASRVVEAAVKEARYGRMPPAISMATASRRFGYFLDHAEKEVGRPVEGIIGAELHKSGQPHGHGLLSIHNGLAAGDKVRLKDLWRGYRGNEWCRVDAPKSQGDVAGYCAKYMTKDMGEIVFSAGLGRRLRYDS